MKEAEIGVMHHKPKNAKEYSNCQKLGERQGADSPMCPPESTKSAVTLISDFQSSVSSAFKHLVCGNLLWQF